MKQAEGMDVLFLCGETPTWHMHVSGVLILDPSTAPGGFDPKSVPKLLGERMALAPQFSWKLREVPFGLDRPVFVRDPDFDLEQHIHQLHLPPPGDRTVLWRTVGELISTKLDRSRPLWELWLIEGLDDGRVAVLTKIHHSLIDGASGADLVGILMDLTPEPRAVELPPPAPPDKEPSPAELALRGAVSTMTSPVRAVRYADQLARQALTLGRGMLGGTRAGLPFQAPPTSFNRRISAGRAVAAVDVPVERVREVKDAFGVKMNDVILALVGGALRRYLQQRGELPTRSLIAQVPVSLRTETNRSQVGTLVGAMFASMATAIEDPSARLRAIHDSTEDAKQLHSQVAASRRVSLAEVPPPAAVGLFNRLYTGAQLENVFPPIFNLIVSNVPGPPFDLYLSGARVESVYPMGPLIFGSGLNATAFTAGSQVNFGFTSCREQVPEPEAIASGVPLALEELVEAAPRARSGTGG